jgi:hypothetical protein
MRLFVAVGIFGLHAWPTQVCAQADWPGPFIWKTKAQIQRKVADELSHRGEIKWVSKYKEVVLNQPREYERTRTITWDYSREVLAVRGGRPFRDRLVVNAWRWLEQDGLADQSLQGYVFDYRGVDSGRSRRTRKNGTEKLSNNARAWSEHNLRKFEELLFAAIRPEQAYLRVGARWSVDPVKLSIALQLDKMSRVDPLKSKVEGKLGPVHLVKDVFVGRYEIEGVIALGQFPSTQVPWVSGGLLKLKVAVDGPLEPVAAKPYTIKISGLLQGAAQIGGPSGERIERALDWQMTGTWTRSLP